MTVYMASDLRVLGDGTVLHKEWNWKVIGNTSSVSTWNTLLKGYACCQELKFPIWTKQVWSKIPLPSIFEVEFKEDYGNHLVIHELREPSDPSSIEVKEAYKSFTLNVVNPFDLTSEEQERLDKAIKAKKEKEEERWAIRKALISSTSEEIMIAVRIYIEGNPSFVIEKTESHSYSSIYEYKMVIMLRDKVISRMSMGEFIKQALPELWEKFENI